MQENLKNLNFEMQYMKEVDSVWGDRKQELVFIGCDPMDEATIRNKLEACFLDTDKVPEMPKNVR